MAAGLRGASPVLAVVLAAGGSTRMGRPKQLAELDGRPLLAHVLAALADAPVDRVVVALGGAASQVLGDQPLVTGATVARVVEAWRAGAGPAVTAAYRGRPGHPKLFDRRLLPELLRLAGDAGARDLLAAHPEWVHRVEVGDLGSDADIDVEADLERVGRMLTTGRHP
jgi:CTP:molybdopterin cytidylyltransferase MocA